MRVIAFDPSSTCIGYAVLDQPGGLKDAGLLKPARTRDDYVHRVSSMLLDAGDVLAEWLNVSDDRVVAIETTTGKVHRRIRGASAGAGLPVYGFAVGAMWQAVLAELRYLGLSDEVGIRLVPENKWTRGVAKGTRCKGIAQVFGEYDRAADPGGDMGDAIGLALYVSEQRGDE